MMPGVREGMKVQDFKIVYFLYFLFLLGSVAEVTGIMAAEFGWGTCMIP